MTRTMYDSTNPFDIPTTAAMVAGYLAPSPSAWSPAGWARFPTAVKVRIAVRASTNDGHVLDVENGDATPAQAPGWVSMRRLAGVDPTVYCDRTNRPLVIAACLAAGIQNPHFWIADPNDGPVIPDGDVAVQFATPPNSGGHWDLSVVSDYWPGVDMTTPNTPDDAAILGYVAGTARVTMPDGAARNMLDHEVWTEQKLAAVLSQASSNGTGISAILTALTALAADVATIKAFLPVGTLSGTATVTVNLTEGGSGA